MRRTTPKIILAAFASVALLAGCSGPAAPKAPTNAPQASVPAAQTTPDQAPAHWEARVIDVIAGDKLRVQVTNEVYLNKGEKTRVESDLGTIVVKDPVYDAPAVGECGHEAAAAHLTRSIFKNWPGTDENPVMVTLDRQRLDETLPATDADGAHLLRINYDNSPYSYMLSNGYAKVGHLLGSDSPLLGEMAAAEQRGKNHGNPLPDTLWVTCWQE